MASSVLPVFARGVRHAYDGVTPNGFCGTWFDGGLRSGFPAYRALRITRPAVEGVVANADQSALRVLAVGTGPLEGLVNSRPSNVLDITLNAVGQMSGQDELAEVVLAQQVAIARQDEMLDIMHKARARADAGSPASSLDDDSAVSAVYVPAETPPFLVAGAEYSFDRTLMRGLWVWGRHLAIERVLGRDVLPGTRKLFARLGWSDLERTAVDEATRDAQTMKPWFDAFSQQTECSDHQQLRKNAGHNRITSCVPGCVPIVPGGTTFPRYFECPDGGSAPAAETRNRSDAAHRGGQ
jgi:hypothetical protein